MSKEINLIKEIINEVDSCLYDNLGYRIQIRLTKKMIELLLRLDTPEVRYFFENYNDQLKQITNLENELALTKKALELACAKLPMEYEYCSNHPERYNLQDEYGSDEPYWVEEGGCEFDSPENCTNCVVHYFKTKAKESRNETEFLFRIRK